MRRAGTSPSALTLPPLPSVTLEIVRGRQRVTRSGIFITTVGKRRRTVYQQHDGEIILADECTVDCPEELPENWPVTFVVSRRFDCPIDEHRLQLLRKQEAS